jgi:hypothetical protein
MNGQSFTVVVEYPNGKVKDKTCAVGGGHMTADQLAQQYVDVDAFPGAKSVSIYENGGDVPLPKRLQDVLKQRRMIASKVRPRTPVPKIANRDGAMRDSVLRKPGDPAPGPYVGETSIDEPASPAVNSPAAQEARAIATLAAGESVTPLEQPAQPAAPAENESEPPKNESERSQPVSPPVGQVAPRKPRNGGG